jgi:methionine-rich copper-binding protein CopC
MRLATIMAAGLLALAAVTTALGHAAPERFDPAPGAVLEATPERVDGWFVEDVRRQEGASFIKVFDADANQVDDGTPVIDDSDRRHAYVNLTPGLGEGRYMVAWQTLSDDDEELDGGCFWFFVGQAAADEAHQEALRINAAEDCPVDIEEASVIFGQQEGETQGEAAADGGGGSGVDTWVPIVVGIAVGAVTLLVGGGLGSIVARRR